MAYLFSFNLLHLDFKSGNVYGPGQNPSSPYSGVLSILTDCLNNKKPFTLYGDGSQTRDLVYVEDVIQALWLITKSDTEHEVFNIANGNEASLNAIIETYEKVAGMSLQIKKAPGREGEVKRSVANIGKLIKLGYTTKWSLEAGLSKYLEGAQRREASRN